MSVFDDAFFEARERQLRMRAAKVLFVGNSLTYWNRGVDTMVRQLVPGIETKAVVEGGATLESHWSGGASSALEDGSFGYVVLQDDLPETTVPSFEEHAALWIGAARKSGATPVLFAAHAYERLPEMDAATIAAAHARVGERHGVAVADVGAARDAPDVDLFDEDQEHPSLAGTYVAACVVAQTIFGPTALQGDRPYRPKNLKAKTAARLRDVVAATAAARPPEPQV